jgi:hypothetical protein
VRLAGWPERRPQFLDFPAKRRLWLAVLALQAAGDSLSLTIYAQQHFDTTPGALRAELPAPEAARQSLTTWMRKKSRAILRRAKRLWSQTDRESRRNAPDRQLCDARHATMLILRYLKEAERSIHKNLDMFRKLRRDLERQRSEPLESPTPPTNSSENPTQANLISPIRPIGPIPPNLSPTTTAATSPATASMSSTPPAPKAPAPPNTPPVPTKTRIEPNTAQPHKKHDHAITKSPAPPQPLSGTTQSYVHSPMERASHRAQAPPNR